MAKKRNQKIIKYRKPFQINIGVIIFIFIFIYMLYCVFRYFTAEQISAYEVKQGTIAQNTTFDGLILRDETIYYAESSGYINYYCKAGTKASVGSYIYSIDESGEFYQQMSSSNNSELNLTTESYRQLTKVIDQYLDHYSDQNFKQIYQFKYDMEATLVDVLNDGARNEISSSNNKYENLHAYKADSAGIVVYYTDGLETVTKDTFTADMFDAQAYQKENYLQRETVSEGDAVYKMINSEYWHIIIPITDELAEVLAEEKNIEVEFKKDNTTAWASTQIIKKENDCYLILEFKNSMIRFANDRYIELELLLSDTSGLKIPNTAITTKEFLTIPVEYVTKGGNSNNNGLFIERINKNGETEVIFVEVTLFYETEEVYYIDSDELIKGDIAIKPDSNERYILQITGVLEGVYNINKGYAIFKRIEKLYENEEYTIIKSGTKYGISMYDHIALNSNIINEDDIVH